MRATHRGKIGLLARSWPAWRANCDAAWRRLADPRDSKVRDDHQHVEHGDQNPHHPSPDQVAERGRHQVDPRRKAEPQQSPPVPAVLSAEMEQCQLADRRCARVADR